MSHAIFSTVIFFHSSQVCSPGWVIFFLTFTYEYKLKVSKTLYTIECQNCFNYIKKDKKKKRNSFLTLCLAGGPRKTIFSEIYYTYYLFLQYTVHF